MVYDEGKALSIGKWVAIAGLFVYAMIGMTDAVEQNLRRTEIEKECIRLGYAEYNQSGEFVWKEK